MELLIQAKDSYPIWFSFRVVGVRFYGWAAVFLVVAAANSVFMVLCSWWLILFTRYC